MEAIKGLNYLLKQYGKKEVFERRLREGNTEVAWGIGSWVGSNRIVFIWSFYHLDGKILTYEQPKIQEEWGPKWCPSTTYGNAFEETYNANSFKEHLDKWKINISNKTNLQDIIDNWDQHVEKP